MTITSEDRLLMTRLAKIIAKDIGCSYEGILEQLEPGDESSPYKIARFNDEQFEAYVKEVWELGKEERNSSTLDEIRVFLEEKRREAKQKSSNGKYVLVLYDDFDGTPAVCGRYDNMEIPLQIAKKESEDIPDYSKNLLSYRVYGPEGRILLN